MCRTLPLLCLLLLAPSVRAEETWTRLEDGVGLEQKLKRGRQAWVGRIEIPADARALGVAVFADGDVDLFVSRQKPVLLDLEGTSDVGAYSSAPYESVSLTPLGQVALVPGTWYVTVENPYAQVRGVTFELVAFVDRADGPVTLLPDRPALVTVSGNGHATSLRTWLPARARAATIDLSLPTKDGLRYELHGPGSFGTSGAATERIELGGDAAPAGAYTLTLATPGSTNALGVSARLTWTFPDGLTLPATPDPLLQPGVPQVLLLGGAEHGDVKRFRIPVAEGVGGFVLEASNPDGRDIDLFVSRAGPPQDGVHGADWLAFSTADRERLVVGGTRELPAGVYHGEILLNHPDFAVEVTVEVTLLDVGKGPYTWSKTQAPAIQPDDWLLGRVTIATSAVAWYGVDLPAGAKSVHVQLLDATAPLDLFLAREDDGSITHRALTPLVNERLKATFEAPLPAARRVLVGVLNREAWEEEEVTYRVSVGVDRAPELPQDLAWPPVFRPLQPSVAERVAAAAVEITIGDSSGGSGVLVSPRGLVLSCRHCLEPVEGEEEVQRAGILVALTQRPDHAAVQAYYAKVWAEYPDQDLVLLELTEDVFGRKIPADLALPYLTLGQSDALRLGHEVWVGGFPQEGSEALRTPVVITRGVVAGMERVGGKPRWLKTDAWIAPGHSGGPLTDGQGALIGLSAATLGSTESLGLAVPISRLPPEWKSRIEKDLR